MPTHPRRLPSPRIDATPSRRASLSGLMAAALVGALGLAGPLGCKSDPPPPPVEVGPIAPESFKASWSVNLNTERYGQVNALYLRGESLLVYTDNKVVAAISAGGGTTQFIATDVARREDLLYPPLLMDALGRLGNVSQFYAFPKNNSYVLLNLEGRRISEAQLQRNLTSPSAAAAGVAYVGTADDYGGRLMKIDPTKVAGHQLERVLFPGDINAKPAVFQGLIFAADLLGNVYATDEQLTQAWTNKLFSTETNRPVTADLAVDEYGVYVSGQDGTLYCLDRQRGRIKWRFLAGQPLYRRAVPTQDYVFQPVPGDGVVALAKAEGSLNSRQPAWTAENATDVLSFDNRRVYLLHESGHIVAHDIQTGEELFRSKRNDFDRFARNTTGPRIYAATREGEVLAIDPILTRGEVGTFAIAPLDAMPVAKRGA